MNVLLVDDFPIIVDSLKRGVKWERAGFSEIYTACNAREAKLLLMNFPIDVMLCDIEMPEENGLELVKWTREKFPDIECIFLTSHAEFDYVKEALRIGSFDYILQPVKFEDVEQVMFRVAKKIDKKRKENQLVSITQKAISHENEILEMVLTKLAQDKESSANQICSDYRFMCSYFFEECAVYQMILRITRWKRIINIRKQGKNKAEIREVLKKILGEVNVRIGAAETEEGIIWFIIFADKKQITEKIWERKVEEFYDYIMEYKDFEMVVFPCLKETGENYTAVFKELLQQEKESQDEKNGIIAKKRYSQGGTKSENMAIKSSLKYIENNLSKNLSRTEVANEVHLSEEYFSRLFKQETGETFKDYIVMVKMEAAKAFLLKTQLSVSIVASKVGYSNFSHFSHTFKNFTGLTPQEYRKIGEKKDE